MQKEIWMADMEPVAGSEQGGKRPVVVISGPSMNAHHHIVIICPLTSKIKSYKGCPEIHPDKTNNLKFASQAIPFQVRAIAKARLKVKIGVISDN